MKNEKKEMNFKPKKFREIEESFLKNLGLYGGLGAAGAAAAIYGNDHWDPNATHTEVVEKVKHGVGATGDKAAWDAHVKKENEFINNETASDFNKLMKGNFSNSKNDYQEYLKQTETIDDFRKLTPEQQKHYILSLAGYDFDHPEASKNTLALKFAQDFYAQELAKQYPEAKNPEIFQTMAKNFFDNNNTNDTWMFNKDNKFVQAQAGAENSFNDALKLNSPKIDFKNDWTTFTQNKNQDYMNMGRILSTVDGNGNDNGNNLVNFGDFIKKDGTFDFNKASQFYNGDVNKVKELYKTFIDAADTDAGDTFSGDNIKNKNPYPNPNGFFDHISNYFSKGNMPFNKINSIDDLKAWNEKLLETQPNAAKISNYDAVYSGFFNPDTMHPAGTLNSSQGTDLDSNLDFSKLTLKSDTTTPSPVKTDFDQFNKKYESYKPYGDQANIFIKNWSNSTVFDGQGNVKDTDSVVNPNEKWREFDYDKNGKIDEKDFEAFKKSDEYHKKLEEYRNKHHSEYEKKFLENYKGKIPEKYNPGHDEIIKEKKEVKGITTKPMAGLVGAGAGLAAAGISSAIANAAKKPNHSQFPAHPTYSPYPAYPHR